MPADLLILDQRLLVANSLDEECTLCALRRQKFPQLATHFCLHCGRDRTMVLNQSEHRYSAEIDQSDVHRKCVTAVFWDDTGRVTELK